MRRRGPNGANVLGRPLGRGDLCSPGGTDRPVCPIHGMLETLTRPWTLHILWALSNNGPMRFGALRRAVEGISSRVLTQRLRGLEEKGFLYREYKATIPPEVTYGLTKRMRDIQSVLGSLELLARKWQMQDVPTSVAVTPGNGGRRRTSQAANGLKGSRKTVANGSKGKEAP